MSLFLRRRILTSGGFLAVGGDDEFDILVNGVEFRVHVFTTVGSSQAFEVVRGENEVDVLVVGGGGSGSAGGGGAGGLVFRQSQLVTSNDFAISVGSGGASPGNFNTNGVDGSPSLAFGLTANGGGGGGRNSGTGRDGGSGGGDGFNTGGSTGFGLATQPGTNTNVTNDAGFRGGNAPNCSGPDPSAGGGGAAQVGGSVPSCTSPAGGGGNGLDFSSVFGSGLGENGFFAGGGGGGIPGTGSQPARGLGGVGGGGNGGSNSTGATNESGQANTGGGGGGGASNSAPGAGGSGIVIVRYPLQPV